MDASVRSISTTSSNIRQDVYPLDPWTITTRKGIIMQSKCTCRNSANIQRLEEGFNDNEPMEYCDICRYHRFLPQLNNLPDMLFNNNVLRLEHYTGVGVEFNPLDALKLVEETTDPLRVAVADGWQSARADCPFARNIMKPFDWTFTTSYRGTLLSAVKRNRPNPVDLRSQNNVKPQLRPNNRYFYTDSEQVEPEFIDPTAQTSADDHRLYLTIEETDERIDLNKLKVREEILFYDDITLYEDELADHGTAQYSVKVRVMPSSLFILARFYLRIDGVLARLNDTRIYHDLKTRYLLREYTNREARISTLNLPVQTLINPNELMNHLPLINSRYEKLNLPRIRQ